MEDASDEPLIIKAVMERYLVRMALITVELYRGIPFDYRQFQTQRRGEWTLFTDGASNSKGSGAGLVLISASGVEFTYALRLNFASTNNEEEYEAFLAGLRMQER
ncbi:reverse transcriptase domain-containing protein [Tanacetum coccineum]